MPSDACPAVLTAPPNETVTLPASPPAPPLPPVEAAAPKLKVEDLEFLLSGALDSD